MEGLLRVMKLPQMFMKALLKAGPWFGVGAPTREDSSAPCSAPMTEYWYLYDLRLLSVKVSASQ